MCSDLVLTTINLKIKNLHKILKNLETTGAFQAEICGNFADLNILDSNIEKSPTTLRKPCCHRPIKFLGERGGRTSF
ncbi:hypothetical protein DPMN_183295 [Dreissena polymorpha]|uniref:Uncharacterized protein n=1 Tax=Dreissena polymorpha TaxID=45954 RepID=A0A9D4I5F2_DREPO|nr:hypothetical protein DPMN_183295 [Dreissena polymorpha]